MIAVRRCRRPEAIWVQLSGAITPLDLAKIREVGAVMMQAEGPAQVIVDFSSAESVDLSDEVLRDQGRRPPYSTDRQRVFVAHDKAMRERLSFYGMQQIINGFAAPPIVDTLVEALALTGCRQEDFRPLDTSWLNELEVPGPGKKSS
jgi:hypothetical protein